MIAHRRVADSVNSPALSPNRRYLAYLTYPYCSSPARLSDVTAGAAQFLPSVVAVLDLRTGATVRTASPDPGRPFWRVSWSPAGRRLLVGYSGYYDQLMIVDPAHPDYRSAYRVPAPKGCGYLSGSWTTAGIIAAEDCVGVPGLSPRHLVRLTRSGRQLDIVDLPDCINGFATQTGPARNSVVVETDIGYGSGACGKSGVRRFSTYTTGGALRTIVDQPLNGRSISLG